MPWPQAAHPSDNPPPQWSDQGGYLVAAEALGTSRQQDRRALHVIVPEGRQSSMKSELHRVVEGIGISNDDIRIVCVPHRTRRSRVRHRLPVRIATMPREDGTDPAFSVQHDI